MLSTLEGLKDDFNKLAGALNQFKSEAVQVKLLDRFFNLLGSSEPLRDTATKPQTPVIKPNKATARKMKRKAMGATGAVHALIAKGYFKSRRTIAEIVQACESKAGVTVKVTNLSGPLGTLVAAKKLLRAKNKDGRFEYWAK